ncbi:cholinesterase-like [Crotalus adamanteus]|uniref:Cholinesterase-like n=1 Tax=Crotalus adamanteus TaxID=8729 RepID=A0AAW1BV51_CROAD
MPVNQTYTEAEARLSRKMMQYWAEFARTGSGMDGSAILASPPLGKHCSPPTLRSPSFAEVASGGPALGTAELLEAEGTDQAIFHSGGMATPGATACSSLPASAP